MNAGPEQTAQEESIVWLEDVSLLPYVRETVIEFCAARRRRPRFDLEGRMVGYATLRADAEGRHPGCFTRRIFWLKPYDFPNPGPYESGKASPDEGVMPSSVKPGEPGQRPRWNVM